MHGSLFSGKQSGYLREVSEKQHYEFQVGKKGICSVHLGHKACVRCILESSIPVQACVVAPLLLHHWQELTYQEHGQGPFEGMVTFPVWK